MQDRLSLRSATPDGVFPEVNLASPRLGVLQPVGDLRHTHALLFPLSPLAGLAGLVLSPVPPPMGGPLDRLAWLAGLVWLAAGGLVALRRWLLGPLPTPGVRLALAGWLLGVVACPILLGLGMQARLSAAQASNLQERRERELDQSLRALEQGIDDFGRAILARLQQETPLAPTLARLGRPGGGSRVADDLWKRLRGGGISPLGLMVIDRAGEVSQRFSRAASGSTRRFFVRQFQDGWMDSIRGTGPGDVPISGVAADSVQPRHRPKATDGFGMLRIGSPQMRGHRDFMDNSFRIGNRRFLLTLRFLWARGRVSHLVMLICDETRFYETYLTRALDDRFHALAAEGIFLDAQRSVVGGEDDVAGGRVPPAMQSRFRHLAARVRMGGSVREVAMGHLGLARRSERLPGWILLGQASLAPIARARDFEVRRFALLALGLLLLVWAVAAHLGARITHPVEAMTRGLEQVAMGHLDRRVGTDRPDELGETGRRLDAMTDWLQERRVMSRFVAPQVLDLVAGGDHRAARQGNRALAAVLVSDIRSFTTISESHPPEVVFDLVNRHMEAMSPPIREQGGIIERFVGDAVQAVFFDHPGGESPARRAARAGLAMRRAHDALQAARRAAGVFPYEIGVGIEQGEVVCGVLGSEQVRLDFTVLGEVVARAAAWEAASRHGKATRVMVSAEVARHLAGLAQALPAAGAPGLLELAGPDSLPPAGAPGMESRRLAEVGIPSPFQGATGRQVELTDPVAAVSPPPLAERAPDPSPGSPGRALPRQPSAAEAREPSQPALAKIRVGSDRLPGRGGWGPLLIWVLPPILILMGWWAAWSAETARHEREAARRLDQSLREARTLTEPQALASRHLRRWGTRLAVALGRGIPVGETLVGKVEGRLRRVLPGARVFLVEHRPPGPVPGHPPMAVADFRLAFLPGGESSFLTAHDLLHLFIMAVTTTAKVGEGPWAFDTSRLPAATYGWFKANHMARAFVWLGAHGIANLLADGLGNLQPWRMPGASPMFFWEPFWSSGPAPPNGTKGEGTPVRRLLGGWMVLLPPETSHRLAALAGFREQVRRLGGRVALISARQAPGGRMGLLAVRETDGSRPQPSRQRVNSDLVSVGWHGSRLPDAVRQSIRSGVRNRSPGWLAEGVAIGGKDPLRLVIAFPAGDLTPSPLSMLVLASGLMWLLYWPARFLWAGTVEPGTLTRQIVAGFLAVTLPALASAVLLAGWSVEEERERVLAEARQDLLLRLEACDEGDRLSTAVSANLVRRRLLDDSLRARLAEDLVSVSAPMARLPALERFRVDCSRLGTPLSSVAYHQPGERVFGVNVQGPNAKALNLLFDPALQALNRGDGRPEARQGMRDLALRSAVEDFLDVLQFALAPEMIAEFFGGWPCLSRFGGEGGTRSFLFTLPLPGPDREHGRSARTVRVPHRQGAVAGVDLFQGFWNVETGMYHVLREWERIVPFLPDAAAGMGICRSDRPGWRLAPPFFQYPEEYWRDLTAGQARPSRGVDLPLVMTPRADSPQEAADVTLATREAAWGTAEDEAAGRVSVAWPGREMGGFTMWAWTDASAVLAPLAAAVRWERGLLAALALLFLWLAVVVARGFLAPLEALRRATGRIMALDFTVALPVDRADEFGRLAVAFNGMARGVREGRLLRRFVSESVQGLAQSGGAEAGKAVRAERVILFLALGGLSARLEREAPEAVVARINRFLGRTSELVQAGGGEIDKFIGGKVLAVFRPERWDGCPGAIAAAARAATAVLTSRAGGGLAGPDTVGIGLAAGPVLEGVLGAAEVRLEHTVLGDPVNLAARLCDLALREGGAFLLEDGAARVLDPGRVEPVGPLPIKGKAATVSVWRWKGR
ncbi:MAG: HAMP domain-containing protein [Candidatus Riflebacteria bacterium]|nr:HAMP domain-containing protein [Candidatus Riflebacteria bacterium]